jgi:hypothetical protein
VPADRSHLGGLGFDFRIDKMREHPEAPMSVDVAGNWIPIAVPGWNLQIAGGASGLWWHCDGPCIQPITDLPKSSAHYRTWSVYFGNGHSFWIMRGGK